MGPDYRHTQVGTATLVVFLLAGAILAAVAIPMWSGGKTLPVLLMVIFFLLFAGTFSTLTVEVGEGRLSFRFGVGLFGKS